MNNERVREESLASVATSLQQDFIRLFDAEKALARQELSSKIDELKRDAMLVAGGAILAGVFALCLVTASILALSVVVAPWIAALIVAGVFGLIAGVLLARFVSRIRKLDPVPRHTVASVKRDVHAVREAVR